MSPNRRGAAGCRRKKNKVAGMGRRTSACKTSVLNLGNSPRVPGVSVVADETKKSLPAGRDERESLPTRRRIMSLLSMAIVPEERGAFRRRFRDASKAEDGSAREFLCKTPIGVVAKAFECEPVQLRSAADMFPEPRIQSGFLNEFYVMDVILNRAPSPAVTGDYKKGKKGDGTSTDVDFDVVCPFMAYEPGDSDPEKDYLYRAVILFLPQCGVFYCHRERRRGDAGVPGTLIAHDMSWLRLQRNDDTMSYTFGADSFVKRFYHESRGERVSYGPSHLGQFHYLSSNHRVSAWRISTGRTGVSQQKRVTYRAIQCHDADGPMLPPDFMGVNDLRKVPADYRAAQYQLDLLGANSARKDGRHYVDGAHHYLIPESCWIIDPTKTHFVDVYVGIDNSKVVGGLQNRESVVMIRNVTKIDAHDDHSELLERLMLQCMELRMSEAEGNARGKTVDRGTMFALGTKVPFGEKKDPIADPSTLVPPKVPTTAPYAANGCVSESLLRNMVGNLATIGSRCFPQVYSVIRDTEENSGLLPVSPMDGEEVPMVTGGGDTDSDSDYDTGSDDNDDDDAETIALRKRRALARIALRKRIALLQRRRRVGYTIDTSVNLGNSSHFDVHDASQSYSVWLEEMLGRGANWCFVLPNVYGTKPDGKPFRGMAVKLAHGVAISWDGRVIRHCTSVSHPDGMEKPMVGEVPDSHFENHLYGTFTGAKERIVWAGRAQSAASYEPPPVRKKNSDAVPLKKVGRKRQSPGKRKRGLRKKGLRVNTGEVTAAVAVSGAVDTETGPEPFRQCLGSRVDKRKAAGRDRTSWLDRREQANGDRRKRGSTVDAKQQPTLAFHWQVQEADLDVGGRYKIPKTKKK
jgi:hypothetical protein